MKEIPDLNAAQGGRVGRFFSRLTNRRILPRVLIAIGLLATVVAVIYARVNYRGERLWAESKREMTAKGEAWEWAAYVPTPVPDAQNMFKAPGMTALFFDDRTIEHAPLDHPVTNDFARTLMENAGGPEILTASAASEYLARTDRFQARFDEIRAALKRPYARIVDDYSRPLSMQFPNVTTWAGVVLVLERRAKCHLLAGETQSAWEELALLWDLRRLVECQGKFITTEGAWMVRGSTRHFLSAMAQGLQAHAWSEPQLAELQSRLGETDAIGQFVDALKCGRALLLGAAESGTLVKAEFVSGGIEQKAIAAFEWVAPRGMMYENLSSRQQGYQKMIDALEATNGVVDPARASAAFGWWKRAQEGLPDLLKDQTMVNEGQIACALERFRLAHGEYPATLDVLVPQFIKRLPHDIVNGESLRYRRTEGGGFLLYSVGWNRTDDGGRTNSNPTHPEQTRTGDWVWGT